MRMASYLQTNLEIVFDHGIQEGEIHLFLDIYVITDELNE